MPRIHFNLKAAYFATIYSTIVLFFPWELINSQGFDDYLIYYELLSNRDLLLEYLLGKITFEFSILSNEVIWALLLFLMSIIIIDPGIILGLISFSFIFPTSYYLFRRHNVVLVFLLLINPYLIDLVLSQIRTALAWFVIFYGYKNKKNTFYLFAMISFGIHISVILFPFIIFLLGFFKRVTFYKRHLDTLLVIICGSLFAYFIINYGMYLILRLFDDVRANNSSDGLSILQMTPFVFLIFLQLISSKEYLKNNIITTTMLFFVTLICFSTAYFSRLRFIIYPFLINSGLNLSIDKKIIFITSFLGFELIAFAYWIS